ncbi:AroM family protein [Actinomadura sp. 21ATH]|uniref:AroM family protein n=1 Tax=Actinomadura sp. 21ATH TaxID=1735444 RepID=UPI0035C24BBD
MLGLVTIGQSPRDDMVPEMLPHLGAGPASVIERGALDGLGGGEIAALAPAPGAAHVLTTRLADGSSVVLDHDRTIGRVEAAVAWLEERGVDATLVVCTGEFPPLRHRRPLLFAERLLTHGVAGLCDPADAVGIVCPLPEQEGMSRTKWAGVAGEVRVAAATPYAGGAAGAVAAAAEGLAAGGARWIVLDCMGYTEEMRAAAARAAGVPVLLARTVVARLAGEVHR